MAPLLLDTVSNKNASQFIDNSIPYWSPIVCAVQVLLSEERKLFVFMPLGLKLGISGFNSGVALKIRPKWIEHQSKREIFHCQLPLPEASHVEKGYTSKYAHVVERTMMHHQMLEYRFFFGQSYFRMSTSCFLAGSILHVAASPMPSTSNLGWLFQPAIFGREAIANLLVIVLIWLLSLPQRHGKHVSKPQCSMLTIIHKPAIASWLQLWPFIS